MPRKKAAEEHLCPCPNCAPPEEEDSLEEEFDFMMLPQMLPPAKPEMRTVGLYGDIGVEKGMETVYSLFALKDSGKEINPETEEVSYKPIEMIICTGGGAATDMFAIYDTMRIVRQDCEISTLGIGEVMSAGVLVLASGTKGKRKIGANCRLMLHSVSAGHHGSLFTLENEFDEFKWMQERYFAAIAAESKLKSRQIKKILDQKVNVYFDAEQAVKYGLADEII